MDEQRLAVTLPGLELKNPIMPASGSFGFGDIKTAASFDLNTLGALVLKTTTPQAKKGNPQPQIAVLKNGILNSVGLTNPGIEQVIANKIPALREKYPDLPLIGSVAGEEIADYVEVAARFSTARQVQAIELNVSCPNIAQGGMQFGSDPQMITRLTQAVKAQTSLPLYVKLTPNVTDIVACAQAAEAGGADGLTMINTVYGMHIDPQTRKPVLGNKMGGWSGPGIKPLAIRMIYQAAHAVKLPIIGVGGITTAQDVIEMYLAGASAVQIGSAQFQDPLACKHIAEQLPAVMDQLNVSSLEELRLEVRKEMKDGR